LELEYKALPGSLAIIRKVVEDAESDLNRYQANMKPVKEMKNRNTLREILQQKLLENILNREERLLFNYQGCQVILPPNMIAEKPFVFLKGQGRYLVELGGTETGNLVRIDNRLNTLKDFVSDQKDEFKKLRARQNELENELAKKESFADEIAVLKAQLEKIDIELGVNKK
jgi:hypothetical protein